LIWIYQDVNQIDQSPARRPKTPREVVAKIFYTRLRGPFVFHGTSSITLDARLVGEAWPPRFFDQTRVNIRCTKGSLTIRCAFSEGET